jgi:hypothetical protein
MTNACPNSKKKKKKEKNVLQQKNKRTVFLKAFLPQPFFPVSKITCPHLLPFSQ